MDNTKGWLVVSAAWVFLAISFGVNQSFNMLLIPMQQEFNSTEKASAMVGTISIGLQYIAAPIASISSEIVTHRSVAAMGAITMFVGLCASSFVRHFIYLYFTFGILVGVGTALQSTATLDLVLLHFPDKYSTMSTTIAVSAIPIGTIFINQIVEEMTKVLNFRKTLRWLCLSAVVVLPTLPLLRGVVNNGDQFGSTTFESDTIIHQHTPNSSGYTVYHSFKIVTADVTPGMTLTDLADKESGTQYGRKNMLKYFTILRDVRMICFVVGILLSSMALSFHYVSLTAYLDTIGINTEKSVIVITILTIGDVSCLLPIAVFGDKLPFRRIYMMIIGTVFGIVGNTIMAISKNLAIIIINSFVLGVARGIILTFSPSACMEVFGSCHSKECVMYYLLTAGIGNIMGQYFTGAMVEMHPNGYIVSFYVGVIFFIVGLISFLLMAIVRPNTSQRSYIQLD